MINRVFNEDKIGYLELDGDKVTAKKKFYGHPQYYYVNIKNKETREMESIRFENAIYSWRDGEQIACK